MRNANWLDRREYPFRPHHFDLPKDGWSARAAKKRAGTSGERVGRCRELLGANDRIGSPPPIRVCSGCISSRTNYPAGPLNHSPTDFSISLGPSLVRLKLVFREDDDTGRVVPVHHCQVVKPLSDTLRPPNDHPRIARLVSRCPDSPRHAHDITHSEAGCCLAAYNPH